MLVNEGHVLIKRRSEARDLVELVLEKRSGDRVKIINLHSKGDVCRGDTHVIDVSFEREIYEESNVCPVCGDSIEVCAKRVMEPTKAHFEFDLTYERDFIV